MNAYEAQVQAYEQELAELAAETGVQILDSNPLFYREIEKNTLRQNCLSYLMEQGNPHSVKQFGLKMYSGDNHKNFQVTLNDRLDQYGAFISFMEQAFEWDLMSYQFYPYYWGNKEEWADLYQYESNDSVFRAFMRSGMARVVVTVRPGFEEAMMFYMATGQVWNGGEIPVFEDDLYLSIVEELENPEYFVEETWKTVLPTNLIALQNGGAGVDANGLPCFTEECDDVNGLVDRIGNLSGENDTPTA